MDGWVSGWMDEWMDEWMGGWVVGWMNGWMDGWMDGWMGGWMYKLRNNELINYTCRRIIKLLKPCECLQTKVTDDN